MTDNTVYTYDPNQKKDAIILTERAIQHILKCIKKRGEGFFRISTKKAGCSGLMYVVDIVDSPQKSDIAISVSEALTVYVDNESLTYLEGTTIDYIKQGLNETFVYKNPNEKGACGCGESFIV